ncbi:MAG: response regulator transcription factor [Acidimicrobiia bacterium]|nr:response regulator transcription factor [Acidimicrobiia bacterium]
MASIVIVEDEHRIRDLLAKALADRGHHVETYGSALTGLQGIIDGTPDIVLLDMGLPDLDGAELLKMIRAVSTVPVIVATARSGQVEIIRTLDAGADDYIVKPFSADEIEARVRAVLRRGGGSEVSGPTCVGDLEIDVVGRRVTLSGELLDLSPKEFDLLAYLAERPGEVISKRDLLATVWREPYGGSEKTIDVHLSWLRKKLGESAADPRYLHTVFGVGVKLVAPET